jgi:hypothetical protein
MNRVNSAVGFSRCLRRDASFLYCGCSGMAKRATWLRSEPFTTVSRSPSFTCGLNRNAIVLAPMNLLASFEAISGDIAITYSAACTAVDTLAASITPTALRTV